MLVLGTATVGGVLYGAYKAYKAGKQIEQGSINRLTNVMEFCAITNAISKLTDTLATNAWVNLTNPPEDIVVGDTLPTTVVDDEGDEVYNLTADEIALFLGTTRFYRIYHKDSTNAWEFTGNTVTATGAGIKSVMLSLARYEASMRQSNCHAFTKLNSC